jgi:hypothetical protein
MGQPIEDMPLEQHRRAPVSEEAAASRLDREHGPDCRRPNTERFVLWRQISPLRAAFRGR